MHIETGIFEDFDWGDDWFAVKVDGETVAEFYISSDSPEDNTFSRTFSDVINFPEVIKNAYESGRKNPGEPSEIIKRIFDTKEDFMKWIDC